MSDNSFSISTSQNVDIHYDMAGLGWRMLADLIDIGIKFGYYLMVQFIVLFLIFVLKMGTAGYVIIFFFYLPLLFYSVIFETFMQGQTPGKKIMKLRVVKIDGQPAGFGSYLLRWIFIFIDINPFFPIIGLLCIIFSKRQQRVGDMLAQTTVIKLSNTVSLKDTIYERIHNNYTAIYPEARVLSESDMELIRKVLNTAEYRHNYDMVYTLTNKIQNKMNVARGETSPEDFLRTVMRDYNALIDE